MTPLTEHQALNGSTPAYDVEYRWFVGPVYDVLARTGIEALWSTWTAPDTGKPSTWTDVTSQISFSGKFSRTCQAGVVDWSYDVRGEHYSAAVFPQGVSLVCWQRFWRPTGTLTAPAGWQAWSVRFCGMLIRRTDTDDWRHGHTWSGTVVSSRELLSRVNAPRLVTGKIRVTDGASVTASTALTQPALEADQGEFTGGTAAVSADNVVDGSRNTLYISDATPTATVAERPAALYGGVPWPSEVFVKPLAGWAPGTAWWVEVFQQRNQDSTELRVYLGDHTAGTYTTQRVYGDWAKLAKQEYAVFCGNRSIFDLYTGAGNSGAALIVDISQFATPPTNFLTDGLFMVAHTELAWNPGGAIAWAPGGASRTYVIDGVTVWNGPTLDSDTLVAGQSWLNLFDGTDGAGSGTWGINASPHPGTHTSGTSAVWLKVVLPDNVCVTLDEIDATSEGIRLDSYRGWVVPAWRDGATAQGIVGGCVFDWLGRNATTGLTGVTWVNAPSAPIPAGTRCYPYVDSLAQTGYPVTATHLRRRKLPTVAHYKVYWSPYATARDFSESGWASDYYTHHHETLENAQTLRLSDELGDANTPFLWVRSLMYLIYGMTDSGRAKVNEIEVDLAQMALDLTGAPGLDSSESWVLAQYLFSTWAGLAATDFVNQAGVGGHQMGQHALAITPVANVLADLARATGALCRYRTGGGLAWGADPWWPKNDSAPELLTTLTASTVRGALTYQNDPPALDYVILNALSLDGAPHTMRYVYPQPWGTTEPPIWAMVTEVSDRVLACDADAPMVAQREAERLITGAKTCRVTLTGPGEWCVPGQRVRLTWDFDADSYAETTAWTIATVTTSTEQAIDGTKKLATELLLQGFRG